jgi:hypothetical protein
MYTCTTCKSLIMVCWIVVHYTVKLKRFLAACCILIINTSNSCITISIKSVEFSLYWTPNLIASLNTFLKSKQLSGYYNNINSHLQKINSSGSSSNNNGSSYIAHFTNVPMRFTIMISGGLFRAAYYMHMTMHHVWIQRFFLSKHQSKSR